MHIMYLNRTHRLPLKSQAAIRISSSVKSAPVVLIRPHSQGLPCWSTFNWLPFK